MVENEAKEVDSVTKNEVRVMTLGLLEAVKIIAEKAENAYEVAIAIQRIQDKIEEPNAQEVASQSR